MRKRVWFLLSITIAMVLVGCEEGTGKDENLDQETTTKIDNVDTEDGNKVIIVGTPYTNEEESSVDLNNEIHKAGKIKKVESIMETEEKIVKPRNKVEGTPDIFFKVSAENGGEPQSAEGRFVWYQKNGSAVLLTHRNAIYSMITSSQAEKLRETLNE